MTDEGWFGEIEIPKKYSGVYKWTILEFFLNFDDDDNRANFVFDSPRIADASAVFALDLGPLKSDQWHTKEIKTNQKVWNQEKFYENGQLDKRRYLWCLKKL